MCNGRRNCLNSDDETQECNQLLIANQNKDPSKLTTRLLNLKCKLVLDHDQWSWSPALV
jgi:hypothetical protein